MDPAMMMLLLNMAGGAVSGGASAYGGAQERKRQKKDSQARLAEQRRSTEANWWDDLMDRGTEEGLMQSDVNLKNRTRNSRALMNSAAQIRGALR